MIVAVSGGKGGVGKSTVALNLADALGAVVVDADLGMADLPGSRGPDLHDVLSGRASAFEAVREDGPVPILPCGRTLAGASAADPTGLGPAVEAVRREYGAVVLDCPAGLRSDAGISLLVAESCVLVTCPTRPALSDALRARALAREVSTPLSAAVLNRSDDTPTKRIASLLGAPVTRLPESAPLARAKRRGLPVAALAPESTAAERLRDLAARVQSACNAR